MFGIAVTAILSALLLGIGGIVPDFLPACATAAAIGLLVVRLPEDFTVRRLWWLGLAALAWVLVTTLPLPPAARLFYRSTRDTLFARVDDAAARWHTASRDAADRAAVTSDSLVPPGELPLPADALPPDGAPAADAPASVTPAPGQPPGIAPGATPALPPDSELKDLEATTAQLRRGRGIPAAAPAPVPRRLTLNLAGTRRFFLLAAGAWGMLWMTASLSLAARRRLLKVLVVGGAAVAAIGVLGKHVPSVAATLPWQLFADYGHELSVWPFVNRNHFASFAAMLVPAAMCLVVYPHLGIPARAPANPAAALLRAQTAAAERLLYLVAFGILTLAVFFSLSRGGIMALLVGVVFTVLYWLRGRQAGASTAATILGIGVLLGLLFLPSDQVQERLGTMHSNATRDRSEVIRFQYWRDTLGIWREFSLAGTGFESFRTVFKSYQTVPGISGPRYAENEYVQLLADGGIAGALFAAGLAALWLRAFGRSRRDADAYSSPRTPPREQPEDVTLRPLRAAVIGAVAVAAFHCLVDFPLRIPLNAFLLATLLGCGLPRPGTAPTLAAATGQRHAWLRRLAAFAGAATLLAAVIAVSDRVGLPQAQPDRDAFSAQAAPPALLTGLATAPTYWLLWYELGSRTHALGTADPAAAAPASAVAADGWWRDLHRRLAAALGTPLPGTPGPVPAAAEPPDQAGPPAPGAAALRALALDCFRQAAAYTPQDYRTWWVLGLAELQNGNRAAARAAFDHAVELAPYLAPDAEKMLQARTPSEFPTPPRFQ